MVDAVLVAFTSIVEAFVTLFPVGMVLHFTPPPSNVVPALVNWGWTIGAFVLFFADLGAVG